MNKQITKNGKQYVLPQSDDSHYVLAQELTARKYEQKKPDFPEVLCAKCLAAEFQIGFGYYSCIARCKCGNEFEIYSG